MKRDKWIGILLTLVNATLYLYLVAHLSWSGTWPFALSLLFVSTSTFFFTWNTGYAYTIYRRSRHRELAIGSDNPTAFSSVSVIVPIYRESADTLTRIVDGVLKMDYPADKLRLYLCDDTPEQAHRDMISQICTEMGKGRALYRTRDHRRGFKAGAINDILPQITDEYIIVLDADHVPGPAMVKQLVAAKQKSEADFLMFPQYFRNQDENAITVASSTKQLVDYKVERFGRCVTNSSFCVTTNWICQADCLRQIGGLDESTVTEDLATGLIAHAKGLRIGILDKELAHGLAPNSLKSWRDQQYRWSSGTFQVARTIFPRLWRKLSWHQRLDYFLCITWYFSGLFQFFLYLFPISTAVGIRFFHYNSSLEFLSVTLSLIAISWTLTNYPTYLATKSLRKTIMTHAASLGIGDIYIKALLHTLTRKKPHFTVTGKDVSERFHLTSALGGLKYHLLFVAVGIIVGFHSLFLNRSIDTIVNFSWIWYNNIWVLLATSLLGRN